MILDETPQPDEDGYFEPIEVQLSISPGGDCECLAEGQRTATVEQSFNMDCQGEESCQMVVSRGDVGEYEKHTPIEACPCLVFSKVDCVSELTELREGRMHYTVTLPDRTALAGIVEQLRDVGATVSVNRILTAEQHEDELPTLTDKQRETLFRAIESGYYERPRQADLDDIAESLDISASAASQRLNSVKRRLIEKYTRQVEGVAD